MPETTTLTETEQQKQTDKPEHHQTQAATGSPQAGSSSTAGSTLGSSGATGSRTGSTGSSGSSMGSSPTGGSSMAGSQSYGPGSSMTGGISSSGQPSPTSGGTGLPRRRGMNPLSLLGNPLGMMRSLVDDMDRLFEDFLGFGGSPSRYRQPSGMTEAGTGSALQSAGGGYGTSSLWYPQIEVAQRGGNLVVCADLPGIRKEDVHLEIHDDYLVLEGERRQESEENQGGVYRSERSYGRFYRTIPLPDGVNPEQVRANFKDGVLEVTVPMPTTEQRQGRRIEIQEG